MEIAKPYLPPGCPVYFIEATLDLLRPFGIVEMVRTGVVAMVRGPGRVDSSEVASWGSAARKEAKQETDPDISHSV